MMVELTPEIIKELASARNGYYSWDYVAGLAVWIIGVEAENERLQQRIAELEEALTKIANYESMRFKLSPYEYGLLEQIVGIAEHALRDGE